MKKFIFFILILCSSVTLHAEDSTKVLMRGVYSTTEGRLHAVYLDKSKSRLFYERVRKHVTRVYFRKVDLSQFN